MNGRSSSSRQSSIVVVVWRYQSERRFVPLTPKLSCTQSHPLNSTRRQFRPSTTRSHPYLNSEFPRDCSTKEIRFHRLRITTTTTTIHRSSLDYSSSRLCSQAVSCRVLCPWATYSSGAILKLVLTVALEIIILCTCSCRKADALPLLDKRRLVVCTCHCSRNRNSSRTSFPILVVRGYGWFSCFCCCLFLIPLYTY